MSESRLDLSPLRKALASLDLALAQPKNEFLRDSVIQRFEYTYDLSWKLLKRHLEEDEGVENVDRLTRKELLRMAFEKGLIAAWKTGSPITAPATTPRMRTMRTRQKRSTTPLGVSPRTLATCSPRSSDAPMLDVRPEELVAIRAILREHVPDLSVWAFGSRVAGRRKRHSDLDLVVVTKTPLPLGKLGMLGEAFADSDLPFRVDVVDWARTSDEFRAVIRRAYEPVVAGTNRAA
jgi:uncharacterized protein